MEDRTVIVVRLGVDNYKKLRDIANKINRDFDMIGRQKATPNDVLAEILQAFCKEPGNIDGIGAVIASRKK